VWFTSETHGSRLAAYEMFQKKQDGAIKILLAP
jgi:hypothetical protein